jgi:phage/plasmid-like protein (TIGR03299 family)
MEQKRGIEMTNEPPMRPIEGDAGIAPIAVPAKPRRESPVFDVRDYGWENISLPVPNNVEQALSAANLDWLVQRRPVHVDGEIVPMRWANVRSDLPKGKNVLEIVKSKYQIVQNHEAYAFVQDVLNMGTVRLERAGSFNGGRTVFLLASTEGLKVHNDTLLPYLLFANSHDGSAAVKVCLTTIRVRCKNTLALALASAPRIWSVMHTKSATGRMKAAQESMNFIGQYLTVYPIFVERMMETPISEAGFAKITERLFPIPAETKSNGLIVARRTEAREQFELIYEETPDLDDIRGTAWGVYNAYSDWVSHRPAVRNTDKYEANRMYDNFVGRNLEYAQGVILEAATVA